MIDTNSLTSRWATQKIEPVTELMSRKKIRSFLSIPDARLEDSGIYTCTVQESVEGHTAKDNLTVTVVGECTHTHTHTKTHRHTSNTHGNSHTHKCIIIIGESSMIVVLVGLFCGSSND